MEPTLPDEPRGRHDNLFADAPPNAGREETILYVQYQIATNAYRFISRCGAVSFITFPFFGVPFMAIRSVPSFFCRKRNSRVIQHRSPPRRRARRISAEGEGAKKCDHRSLSLSTRRLRGLGEREGERSHKSAIKRPIFGRPDLRGDRRKQGGRERARRGV